ncbi:MAG: anaerobic ribonucleoside-triphosphate reductase activating protein [Sphaerochaetaceae bacterium]|nr:anaerobic ribonucleoside-triphosphate reductase activating protein [Sphaerochaetaceae bacterium]
MIIAALQKTTLIDYPGKIACMIFTQGCNYDCFYCHNRTLIKKRCVKPMDIQKIHRFLKDRSALLEGIVVSGGEPTIHTDLPDFLESMKALGYCVKLDTNGSNPAMLARLLDDRIVDYVALDVKAPWEKYAEICSPAADCRLVSESLKILTHSTVAWEARTTLCPTLTQEDLKAIGSNIPPSIVWRKNEYRRPLVYKEVDSVRIHQDSLM